MAYRCRKEKGAEGSKGCITVMPPIQQVASSVKKKEVGRHRTTTIDMYNHVATVHAACTLNMSTLYTESAEAEKRRKLEQTRSIIQSREQAQCTVVH